MVQLLGVSALLIPLGLVMLCLRVFVPPRRPIRGPEVLSIVLLISAASVLLERCGVGPVLNFPTEHAGGTAGACLHRIFFKFLAAVGDYAELDSCPAVRHAPVKMSPKSAVRLEPQVAAWSAPMLAGHGIT
jgi:hypothetical protein